tara:strand:- start:670 stop:1338 length:669 start_codon:yes stop_codon:yes gene_type:complete
MGAYGGPDIITDGLVNAFDAGSTRSYPGSGTVATDLVGTNNGTLTNGVGFTTANGGAWDFDGVDDYIRFPIPITVSQPYTVLMWCKPDSLAAGLSSSNRSTPYKGNESWNPGIWVTQGMIRSHGNTRYVDSYIDWSGLEYAQIGMIFDGTTVYNIFNGEILSNFNSTSYSPIASLTILIGSETTSTGSKDWDGQITAETVYNRALSAAEILQNYNAIKNRFI